MPRKAEAKHEYIHPLIYADPGTGKTVLAASAPNTLIIHPPADNIGSALRMGYEFDEEVCRTWDEMTEIYEYLRHEDHGYEWVWWDGISLAQDELLHSIMEDLVPEKPHRELYIPDQREYMINFKRALEWIRYMIQLPFNFGITAHPYRFEIPDKNCDDPDDTEVLYMPWIQGKQMPEKVCGYMNIVGYLDVATDKEGNEHRVLYTKKRRNFYAKDQFGAFNGRMVDPTVPKIEKAIKEAIAKQPTKKRTRSSSTGKKTTTRRKS